MYQWLSATLCLAPIAAQSTVVPSATQGNANSAVSIPGAADDSRLQVLIDSSLLSTVRGRTLSGISFLRDGANTHPYAGGTADITATISVAPHDALRASESMVDNHDPIPSARIAVFQGTVTFPPSASPSNRSVNWNNAGDVVHIQFQTGFRYTSGTLCIDLTGHRVAAAESPAWPVDGLADPVSGTVTVRGDSCSNFGGRADPSLPFSSAFANDRSLVPGFSTRLLGLGPAGGSGAVLIGATPASIDLAHLGLGAAGCQLYVLDAVAVPTMFVDRNVNGLIAGLANVPLRIPTEPGVLGARFSAQFVEFSTPMRTSNALDCAIASRLPSLGMSMVFATFQNGQPPTNGRVDSARGPVIRLHY